MAKTTKEEKKKLLRFALRRTEDGNAVRVKDVLFGSPPDARTLEKCKNTPEKITTCEL